MSNDKFVIDVTKLGKSFGQGKVAAVSDVTIQVRPGEIIGFLGPNGCGKTTTIRMLCGLLTPWRGSGQCLGFDIMSQSKQIREQVGYVTQYFSLYDGLSIYENLVFRAQLHGIGDYQKIESIIELMGFNHRRHQLAKALSGGYKQRLSLAAALLHEPRLILLDEPNAGVDPNARRTFWEIISALSARGTTVLLSSHDMTEVARCHRIAYMSSGKVVMVGAIDDIVAHVGLTTWQVTGPNLPLLIKQLQVTPGVDQVNPSYDRLHVSAKRGDVLEQALQPYLHNPNYKWEKINPELEDVFIWLTNSIIDTRYAA